MNSEISWKENMEELRSFVPGEYLMNKEGCLQWPAAFCRLGIPQNMSSTERKLGASSSAPPQCIFEQAPTDSKTFPTILHARKLPGNSTSLLPEDGEKWQLFLKVCFSKSSVKDTILLIGIFFGSVHSPLPRARLRWHIMQMTRIMRRANGASKSSGSGHVGNAVLKTLLKGETCHKWQRVKSEILSSLS